MFVLGFPRLGLAGCAGSFFWGALFPGPVLSDFVPVSSFGRGRHVPAS